MSKRKPHNEDAGYIAEKIYTPTGSHIVIYEAAQQGIDAGLNLKDEPNRYATVCSLHGTVVGSASLPLARASMKFPDFCNDCMSIVFTPED